MEFPILTFFPMPPPAIRLVTLFLREPHPTALIIEKLTFTRCAAQDDGDEDSRFPAALAVKGEGVRIKDLSTPWPHTYVIRNKFSAYNLWWSAFDTTYMLHFSYDEHTGEQIEKESEGSLASDDVLADEWTFAPYTQW